MNKKIVVGITIALLIVQGVALLPLSTRAAEDADYEETWDIPADGSKDKTEYYSITRDDTSSSAEIYIVGWISNRTVIVDFTNIKDVTLYLNRTDINMEDAQAWLDSMGGEITVKLSSDVSVMDFEIVGIPDFAKARLDGEDWTEYNYYSSNKTIEFTLEMSTHTIEFLYDGFLTDIILIAVVFGFIKILTKSLKDLTDNVEERV